MVIKTRYCYWNFLFPLLIFCLSCNNRVYTLFSLQFFLLQLEIDEEDEKVLATFMPKETGPQLTLADIILQRIKEKDAEVVSGKNLSEISIVP